MHAGFLVATTVVHSEQSLADDRRVLSLSREAFPRIHA